MEVCYILALIFFVLSVFLFNSRGAWLIAGFNTLSAEEKQQYDVKKLCRAVGFMCLVCAIMLCALALFISCAEANLIGDSALLYFSLAFVAVIFASIGLTCVYVNKSAKK